MEGWKIGRMEEWRIWRVEGYLSIPPNLHTSRREE
jgi:hypothetical protein